MPWDFFERNPVASSGCLKQWRLPVLALVWLGGLFAVPGVASSRVTWINGSFPVASFAGFTSGFGMRNHPFGGDRRMHYGVDIAAPLGSEVRSWWSGRVSELISDSACGTGLVIRSGDYEHIYCHLGGRFVGSTYRSGAISFRLAQVVSSGQSIAHVGLSGSTTGPHLHWALRFQGRWLDPARVLRAMAASRRNESSAVSSSPKVNAIR